MFETKLDRLVPKRSSRPSTPCSTPRPTRSPAPPDTSASEERKAYRAGHYERTLTAKAGKLSLKVPKLKGAVFESAVIERYRRRESSVEEALMEMYLAGVSTRQVDDISQLLWGDRMPSQTLERQAQEGIRRHRRMARHGPWNPNTRTCSWTACGTSAPGAGRVENVSVLVAIGVSTEGRREVHSV